MFAHFTHNCTFGKWNPLRLRLLIFCVGMKVFHTAVCPFDEDIVHSVFGVRFTKIGFEMKKGFIFSFCLKISR